METAAHNRCKNWGSFRLDEITNPEGRENAGVHVFDSVWAIAILRVSATILFRYKWKFFYLSSRDFLFNYYFHFITLPMKYTPPFPVMPFPHLGMVSKVLH